MSARVARAHFESGCQLYSGPWRRRGLAVPEELLHDVAPVDPGGETRGRDDFSVVHETAVGDDAGLRGGLLELRDQVSERRGLQAIEQAGPRQEEGAVADGEDDAGLPRRVLDPGDHRRIG